MHDIELSRHLLGLQPPWSVTRVELTLSEQRVDVWLGHAEGVRFACPKCGGQLPLYDHTEPRVWRHLDSCQFLTYVHARLPRVCCPDHGVHQLEVPWALTRAYASNFLQTNVAAKDLLKEVGVEASLEPFAGEAVLAGVAFEETDGQATQQGQVLCSVGMMDTILVLAEGDIQLPVQAVLDPP